MKLTINQLHHLPWRFNSHIALESGHSSVYETEVDGIKIVKCIHTERIDYYAFGRSYTHYVIGNDKNVYETHKSAVNRINELLAEKGESKTSNNE